jgi:hypothetical protein
MWPMGLFLILATAYFPWIIWTKHWIGCDCSFFSLINNTLRHIKCKWYFNIYWKYMRIFWSWPRESEVQDKAQFMAYCIGWLFWILLIKLWTPAGPAPPLNSAICLSYSSPGRLVWRLTKMRSNTDYCTRQRGIEICWSHPIPFQGNG